MQTNPLAFTSPAASVKNPASGVFHVPFVRPMMPPYELLHEEFEKIVCSGQLTKGPNVQKFEQAIAQRLGVRHAVAVSSCTVGLMLVYKSLGIAAGSCRDNRGRADCRVAGMEQRSRLNGALSVDLTQPMGEVIMPSYTFLAGPAAVVWNNLRPVFIEVDPATTNVLPQTVAAAITPHTVAISACHNFGNPCDVPALEAIAAEHGLPFIIDAAHGFGASSHGKPVGSGGTAQIFSLSPTKLLVAGEGGIVATNCDCLAHFVRMGREYGNDGSYDALFSGVNGRMPELSAALGLASLTILDSVVVRRDQIATLYRQELSQVPGIGFVETSPGSQSSHKDFSITIDPAQFGISRDSLRREMADRGIETRAYYDPPCHLQKAFAHFYDPMRPLPVTELLSARSLSLPMGAHVDEAVVDDICKTIAHVQQTL